VRRNGELVWDRKTNGGFPEPKILKQKIRDLIAPSRDLGHSDVQDEPVPVKPEDCEECPDPEEAMELPVTSPNIEITYCTGCRWLLRSIWTAQELLTTFDTDISSVTVSPSRSEQGGLFVSGTILLFFFYCVVIHTTYVRLDLSFVQTVTLDGEVIWDRIEQGRFPELKELKRIIRDKVVPAKDLGHSDEKKEATEPDPPLQEMSEEEAKAMREKFGVM